MVRRLSILVAALALAGPASAAVEFPDWDVSPSCQGVPGLGGPNFTKSCMLKQDASRYMAKKHWSAFSDADREACIGAGRARKGFPDYRALAGCMQTKVCGKRADELEAITKGPKDCAAWQ